MYFFVILLEICCWCFSWIFVCFLYFWLNVFFWGNWWNWMCRKFIFSVFIWLLIGILSGIWWRILVKYWYLSGWWGNRKKMDVWLFGLLYWKVKKSWLELFVCGILSWKRNRWNWVMDFILIGLIVELWWKWCEKWLIMVLWKWIWNVLMFLFIKIMLFYGSCCVILVFYIIWILRIYIWIVRRWFIILFIFCWKEGKIYGLFGVGKLIIFGKVIGGV